MDGKINAFDFSVVLSKLSPVSPTPAGPTPTTPPGLPPGSWTQTFGDEFNGTTLDTTKWATKYAYDSGHGDRSNNDENEWYVDDAQIVANGVVSLKAEYRCLAANRPENYAPYTGNCSSALTSIYPFTSGIIASYNSFAQKYGYFEARMKIPAGQGLWPAFWLLPLPSPKPASTPWSDANVFWPPEIDVLENKGRDPTTIYMTNIFSGVYPTPGMQSNNWLAPWPGSFDMHTYQGPDYSAGFHTYGVDWEQTGITWYIDGVVRASTTSHLPPGSLSPGSMYLIANLAVGGNFDNGLQPDPSIMPKSLDIDYIRVYQKNP